MGKFFKLSFRPSSNKNALSEETNAFFNSLSQGLNALERSLCDDHISLRWSAKAMEFLEGLHFELLSLLKKSKLPLKRGAEESWLKQYLQDSIAILDFCNSLKLAVSRLDRYRLIVDITVQKLGSNASLRLSSSKTVELERSLLENQTNLGFRMMADAVKLGSRVGDSGHTIENKNLTSAIFASKSAMVLVALLLISAMVSPVSINLGDADLPVMFPLLKPLFEMLSSLARRFHERASAAGNRSGSVLAEQGRVKKAMQEIEAQMEDGVVDEMKLLRSVEGLRTSSGGLREGLEEFDSALDNLFDAVMRGRNEMSAVLRNSGREGFDGKKTANHFFSGHDPTFM
ncbi:hypothetical protein HPP92_016119 [Vanilla planifolia]|uniref:Uncharacterized protein n=1 Tax=Vanilla planifolia TaxID=51239 RepID=A0A835UN64_VANPL|nr:hypothetical protein HPP92_016119 [Vanilla planifolia]